MILALTLVLCLKVTFAIQHYIPCNRTSTPQLKMAAEKNFKTNNQFDENFYFNIPNHVPIIHRCGLHHIYFSRQGTNKAYFLPTKSYFSLYKIFLDVAIFQEAWKCKV